MDWGDYDNRITWQLRCDDDNDDNDDNGDNDDTDDDAAADGDAEDDHLAMDYGKCVNPDPPAPVLKLDGMVEQHPDSDDDDHHHDINHEQTWYLSNLLHKPIF